MQGQTSLGSPDDWRLDSDDEAAERELEFEGAGEGRV